MLDEATLADLVVFARVELASRDVEPWADLLRELKGQMPQEELIWFTTLYNTYDSLGSAWGIFERWPTPAEWGRAPDRAEAADGVRYPRMQERRNLHGLSVLKRHQGYVDELAGRPQIHWMFEPLELDSPGEDFKLLTEHMRKVWGVGRQAAFEWAEFAGKVFGLPVDAADGQLWESSGPRHSLQQIYGNPKPSPAELDDMANECKDHLEANGVALPWVDFETIICDFKVMRTGRYYPGKHLAALREEISGNDMLIKAFEAVVPDKWASIPAGIDKNMLTVYRDTGVILEEPWW